MQILNIALDKGMLARKETEKDSALWNKYRENNFVIRYYEILQIMFCLFLWHRASFFLFSLIKIIIRFKNAQNKERQTFRPHMGALFSANLLAFCH